MNPNNPILINNLFGESFVLFDEPKSATIYLVQKEFSSISYKLFFKSLEHYEFDTVLDCGAHVGIFSCLMKKKYPNKRVIAVEAVQRTFANLTKSVKENNLDIELRNNFIWNDPAINALLMAEDNTGSASIGNFSHCVPVLTGNTVTLNRLFEECGLAEKKNSVVMKMDIERAEYDVLASFKYWDAISMLLVEIHWKSLPPQPTDVADSLNLLGFINKKLESHKIFATIPFEIAFHAGAYLPIF